MSHRPRWIPSENTLVEVTTRTFQGRYLLKPTPEVREIVLGVIGRAQRMYRMKICLLTFMSNHWHALLVPTDAKQLADFMNYVNGQIAKRLQPLNRWKGKLWAKPFDLVLVTDEPAAQRARFRYLLSHGVKEGLVERPGQWIGVHGVNAWLRGEALKGYWFDKTRESRVRSCKSNRGKVYDRLAFANEEWVHLSPLPCWEAEGASLEQIRREIEGMVEEIVRLHRLERVLEGRPRVAGTASVLAKPWHYQPEQPKAGPCPLLHFRSPEAHRRWKGAFAEFLADYRRASSALRAGRKGVRFPARCFPPAAPFPSDGVLPISTSAPQE